MNIPSLFLVGLIAANGLELPLARRRLLVSASASELALWVIVTLLCVVLIVVIYFLYQLQSEKEREDRARRGTTYLSDTTETKKAKTKAKKRWDRFRLRCSELADGVAIFAGYQSKKSKKSDVSQATGSTPPGTPCRRESTFPESSHPVSPRRETVGERGPSQMTSPHASNSLNSFCDAPYKPTISSLSTAEPSGRSTSGGHSLSSRRPLKLWDNESEGVRDSESGIKMPDKEITKFRASDWKNEDIEELYRDNKKLKEAMARLQEELKDARLRSSASSLGTRCRTGSDAFHLESQDSGHHLSASPRAQFNFSETSPVSNRQREMIMRLMRRVVAESRLNTDLQDELKTKTISLQQLQKQVEYLAAECNAMSSDLVNNCVPDERRRDSTLNKGGNEASP